VGKLLAVAGVILLVSVVAWFINPGLGILVFVLGSYGANGVLSRD